MLRGGLVAVYNFLWRGSGEGGTDLFSLANNDRMGGNRREREGKLCQGKFRLDTKIFDFYSEGGQTPEQSS